MSGFIDLVGQIFGSWKVLNRSKQKYYFLKDYNRRFSSVYWDCLCLDCNEVFPVSATSLKSGKSRRCIKCSQDKKRDGAFIPKFFINKIKDMANVRNIAIDDTINQESLANLFINQCGQCALSGIYLTLPKCTKDYKIGKSDASIDRIDNRMHYTIKNVQWTHKWINLMKLDHSTDDFVKFCRLVVNYHKDYLTEDDKTSNAIREVLSIKKLKLT